VGEAGEYARADVAQNPGAQREVLTETRVLALLAQNSSAIKRPVVEAGSALLIGFDPAEYSAAMRR